VTVIGDTVELVNLTADVCATSGLEVADQVALPVASFARWLPDALAAAVRGSGTDAVIVVHVPAVQIDDDGVSEVLLAASADARVPLLAVLHRGDGRSSLVTDPGRDAHHGSVPVFTTVESAVRALTLIVGHARWRSREPGRVPDLPDIDQETARSLVAARLRGRDSAESGTTVPLVGSQLQEMLACYGIDLLESIPVSSEDEAVAAADQTGWPVVLKTLDPRLVRRGEHEGIRLNIESEAALRAAYLSMAATLDDSARSRLEVQPMAPPGVAVTVRVLHDPLFGPTVSCGMAGLVPELLGDRAHTVPPVTDADAARLVRGPGASSILLGYGGREPLDVRRLEDLIVRAGLLAHQIPQLQRLDLDPVIVGANGLAVAGATAWVQPAQPRSDSLVRRLTDI
jgi:acyl-CoA synthetase (NDP forming)